MNNKTTYTLCKHCDHFVDENYFREEDIISREATTMTVKGYEVPMARYLHQDDAFQEYDHNGEPGETRTLEEWEVARPDLFVQHEDDSIGPNSIHHSRRGKSVGELPPEGWRPENCKPIG